MQTNFWRRYGKYCPDCPRAVTRLHSSGNDVRPWESKACLHVLYILAPFTPRLFARSCISRILLRHPVSGSLRTISPVLVVLISGDTCAQLILGEHPYFN